jgi:membrane protease YdiL (CAAX protease family)
MNGKVYPSVKNSILLCLLFLGLQIGLGIIIGLVFVLLKISDLSTLYGVSTGLVNLVALGIVILIGFKKAKRTFNEVFKLNKVSSLLWIAMTIFMVGFVIVSSELDNLVNYVLPMTEMFRNIFDVITTKQAFILSIFVMGIIPGIMEELFFRGLILDGLQRNYSQRKAITISALLFGLIHLNPWQFYGGLIMGLIMALICIKTNSIFLSIYMHFFNNTLYTITVKYRELIPIKGFNSNFATPVEFQPVWFDIIGIIILIVGIILLKKGIEKAKNGAERSGCLRRFFSPTTRPPCAMDGAGRGIMLLFLQ